MPAVCMGSLPWMPVWISYNIGYDLGCNIGHQIGYKTSSSLQVVAPETMPVDIKSITSGLWPSVGQFTLTSNAAERVLSCCHDAGGRVDHQHDCQDLRLLH